MIDLSFLMGDDGLAGLEAVGARRKLWTWKFILMMLINFANGMAGYMTVPLVSKYAVSIGANLTVASSISGILPLVAMVVWAGRT